MQAVIFDMDGTLIDSEPLWKLAEKQVFSTVGVNVSNALSAKTALMTTREVTEFWYQHSPWHNKTKQQVENEVIDQVSELIVSQGQAMAGVYEILNFFDTRNFKIGLSTNAPSRLIPVVLNKLNIASYFVGVSSSEHETEGKPHPAVYLSTIDKLGVKAADCIAFEDSLSGILSAQQAGTKTVVIPAATEFDHAKFNQADIILGKLSDFTDDHLEKLTCVS